MCKRSISWLSYLRGIGIGGQQVMPVIFPEIKKVIASRGITLFCFDEGGRVNNLYDEQIFSLRDNTQILQHLLEQTKLPAWQQLLTAFASADVINVAKHGTVKSLYEEIFAPLANQAPSYQHGLVAALRHKGRLMGLLCLHRSAEQRKFNTKDYESLTKIVPTMSQLLAGGSESLPGPTVLGVPGLMSVTCDGQILSLCPKARQLLFMVNLPVVDQNAIANGEMAQFVSDELRAHLAAVDTAAHASDVEKHVQWRHRNNWGEFMFRAYRMQDNDNAVGEVAYLVTVQLLHPLAMSLVDKRKKLALTPKQLEICIPLVAGHTYDSIGVQQHISKHTVVSHVRTIFSKLEVRNRTELVTALISA